MTVLLLHGFLMHTYCRGHGLPVLPLNKQRHHRPAVLVCLYSCTMCWNGKRKIQRPAVIFFIISFSFLFSFGIVAVFELKLKQTADIKAWRQSCCLSAAASFSKHATVEIVVCCFREFSQCLSVCCKWISPCFHVGCLGFYVSWFKLFVL